MLGNRNASKARTMACFAMTALSAGIFAPLAQGTTINLLESLSSGQFTRPMAISADGSAIVGYARNSNNEIFGTLWRANEPVQTLAPLSGDIGSRGFGVSNGGSVVVGVSRQTSSSRGVRWTDSLGVQLVQTNSGTSAIEVLDVSADGQAVVGRTSQDGFLIDLTGTHILPRISSASPGYPIAISNDGTTVVGWGVQANGDYRAFKWEVDGTLQNLGTIPGYVNSYPTGISADKSTIVGFLEQTNYSRSAFYWKSGLGMQVINPLPGYTELVPSTSTFDGNIIVGNSQAFGGNRAFIWTPTEGMRDLNDVFASILPSGWVLADATISDDGSVLTGLASTGAPNAQAWIATLPEPSSGITLMLTVVLVSRRNRN